MTKMKKANGKMRQGMALLVVLLIVMTITVLSLGFLTRSNVELACGRNMVLREQMDYLAESGLEHAKGLILNPQDIDSAYWTGAAAQQLTAGGDDYYDVTVTRLGPCDYQISSEAYRLKEGAQTGRSALRAELRLDPTIALWVGADATLPQMSVIDGDVYCNGALTDQGFINGDVFADSSCGTVAGQLKLPSSLSLQWPRVTVQDFTMRYPVQLVNSSLSSVSYGPYEPAMVCYRNGSVQLAGGVQIEGMLVVAGDLTVSGAGNVIIASKNLPALLVTGDLRIRQGGRLDVYGLGVVDGKVQICAGMGGLNVLGGLFVNVSLEPTLVDSSGNDNRGVLHNGPTHQPFSGQIGGALAFDGVDDYVQTDNDASNLQLTGDYTAAVWIWADPVQENWAGIFSKCSADAATNHWTLQFDNISPKKLIMHHPSASWDTGVRLADVTGAWHHVRIVRQGDLMTSYLDANQVHSNTWGVNPGSGWGHLNIGADRTALSTYTYKGLLDDLRIYNRAPDANQTYPQTGLLGHWAMDESGPDVAVSAEPSRTAIVFWSETALPQKWIQAETAFYRSIERQ